VYGALERCALSLNDLVSGSERSLSESANREGALSDTKALKMPDGSDVKLWNGNGRCSPSLLQADEVTITFCFTLFYSFIMVFRFICVV
jgi:hypothetical protein